MTLKIIVFDGGTFKTVLVYVRWREQVIRTQQKNPLCSSAIIIENRNLMTRPRDASKVFSSTCLVKL